MSMSNSRGYAGEARSLLFISNPQHLPALRLRLMVTWTYNDDILMLQPYQWSVRPSGIINLLSASWKIDILFYPYSVIRWLCDLGSITQHQTPRFLKGKIRLRVDDL